MTLLDVVDLKKHFVLSRKGLRRRPDKVLKAVDGVTFSVARGEILGLVGESGSGKTTTGLAIARLQEPSSGKVTFDGVDVVGLPRAQMRSLRKRMQFIFQDPFASLNPRMTIGDALAEPLIVHGLAKTKAERVDRVAALLESVGMSAEHARRHPHEFSGGQRQRIGIARALAVEPELLIADEPSSALDVSVRAQIIELIASLRDDLGLSLIFISHDLALVGYIADRVGVMYLGRLVELGPAEEVVRRPLHPYSRSLLAAVPTMTAGARMGVPIIGEIPSPINVPAGCAFASRCPFVLDACRAAPPPLRVISNDRRVACIRDDILGG